MPWKKHDQNNLLEKFLSKPRYWQLIVEFNACHYIQIKVFKAKVFPIVVVASNSSIVTCLGCQVFPKKLMTNAKTSYAPLDIQKSKLIVT
jgi:hypothetical protein